jgi:hypothetical protein
VLLGLLLRYDRRKRTYVAIRRDEYIDLCFAYESHPDFSQSLCSSCLFSVPYAFDYLVPFDDTKRIGSGP